ncbi:hypothetical protein NQ318_017981 [Aromia moschata]|uniref:Uncharacterized protein n=1 Tax=Aromia moschata TaxID=1265417 RepID=A0AAV8Y8B5_9CUCU|nr:hypothetical protein NQ318_017981 [Aromia moschata]
MTTNCNKVIFNKMELIRILLGKQLIIKDRIISLNTQTIFPPRSCDLTPCDFLLWPYLKNLNSPWRYGRQSEKISATHHKIEKLIGTQWNKWN